MICNWYSKYVSKQSKYALLSTIICGIISYLYLIVNNINNHDNINVESGVGTTLRLGRWSLDIIWKVLRKLDLDYNIPFLNGLMAIVLIALVSVFLVDIFKINNFYLCAAIGGITVVFPTIAGTMLYSFTVVWYCLAILLSVIGVWFISSYQKKCGWIFGTLCFAISLGIYQGYYPYVGALFLIILIKECFENSKTLKEIFINAIKFLGGLIVGYVLYMVLLEVCLMRSGVELSTYQGVAQMGQISLSTIPLILVDMYKSMFTILHEDYYSISMSVIIQWAFRFIYLIIISDIIIIICIGRKKENIGKIIFSIFLLILFPVAVNFIIAMGATQVYILMQYGFVSIFYLAIVLTDWVISTLRNKERLKLALFHITMGVMCVVISNYIYQNNLNYRSLYYTNRQIENYYGTVLTRIKSTEGYKEEYKIYFIGRQKGDLSFVSPTWGEDYIYQDANTLNVGAYVIPEVVKYYLGYSVEDITAKNEEYKKYYDDIIKLDQYPNDNSIKIVDDVILVRFE